MVFAWEQGSEQVAELPWVVGKRHDGTSLKRVRVWGLGSVEEVAEDRRVLRQKSLINPEIHVVGN